MSSPSEPSSESHPKGTQVALEGATVYTPDAQGLDAAIARALVQAALGDRGIAAGPERGPHDEPPGFDCD